MKTTLYLVRHGETYENHDHIVQGILDTQLTSKGIAQADAVGQYFKDIHLDVAYVSPLSRAKDTMKGALKYHYDITPIIRPNLHEIKCGKLQGLSNDEANRQFNDIMKTFKAHPSDFVPPEGESMREVYRRFTSEILEIMKMNLEKTVLVVAHGTVIQTWLSYVHVFSEDCIQFDFLPNGSISCFNFDHKLNPEIKFIGYVPK
ncbi:histidine phosphatase family protein [Pseudoramibacter porci]|uniref:Histidine phosphatase family protein n=1 Tax=Pseudoramibacter porci TaxID=2606631 RepID=A0A7X2TBC8_9FIRM|nr:histidine phosphatase family protein [Pseudoramibacter porci]MSS20678.1 histidine phosphatase family protein [Pseudoramibacter porci]